MACDVCSDATAQYSFLVDAPQTCAADDECHVLNGHCGSGIGGCFHITNGDVTQADLDAIAGDFTSADCTMWVCDCMAPPSGARCVDGLCVATEN
jgi:hypothetical protein